MIKTFPSDAASSSQASRSAEEEETGSICCDIYIDGDEQQQVAKNAPKKPLHVAAVLRGINQGDRPLPDGEQQKRQIRGCWLIILCVVAVVVIGVTVGVTVGVVRHKKQHPAVVMHASGLAPALSASVTVSVPFGATAKVQIAAGQPGVTCDALFGDQQELEAFVERLEAAHSRRLAQYQVDEVVVTELQCDHTSYPVPAETFLAGKPAPTAANAAAPSPEAATAAAGERAADFAPVSRRRLSALLGQQLQHRTHTHKTSFKLATETQTAAASSNSNSSSSGPRTLEVYVEMEAKRRDQQDKVPPSSSYTEWLQTVSNAGSALAGVLVPEILRSEFNLAHGSCEILSVQQLNVEIISSQTVLDDLVEAVATQHAGRKAYKGSTLVTRTEVDPLTGAVIDSRTMRLPVLPDLIPELLPNFPSVRPGGYDSSSTDSRPAGSGQGAEQCGECRLPNAAATTCAAGVCQVVACASGWEDCDRDPANGCEANVLGFFSDDNHCGSCNKACLTPLTCQLGKCSIKSVSAHVIPVSQPPPPAQPQQQPPASQPQPQQPSPQQQPSPPPQQQQSLPQPPSQAEDEGEEEYEEYEEEEPSPPTQPAAPQPPATKPPQVTPETKPHPKAPQPPPASTKPAVPPSPKLEPKAPPAAAKPKPTEPSPAKSKPTEPSPAKPQPTETPAVKPKPQEPQQPPKPAVPVQPAPAATPAAPTVPVTPPVTPAQPPQAAPSPKKPPAAAPKPKTGYIELRDEVHFISSSQDQVTIDVLGNDDLKGADAAAAKLSVVAQPAAGTVSVVPADGPEGRARLLYKQGKDKLEPGAEVDIHYTVTVPGRPQPSPATVTLIGAIATPDSSLANCSASPAASVPGTPVPGLTRADDAAAAVTLPFAVQLYGGSYSSATISPNGWVSLGPSGAKEPCHTDGSWPNATCLGVGPVLAPFWDDLVVDQVLTRHDKSMGAYVIQWTNAMTPSGKLPVGSFQLYIFPNGTLGYVYRDLYGTDQALGISAVIGVRGPTSGAAEFNKQLNSKALEDVGAGSDERGTWLFSSHLDDSSNYITMLGSHRRILAPGLALISHPAAGVPGKFKPWSLAPATGNGAAAVLPLLVSPDAPPKPVLSPVAVTSQEDGDRVLSLSWQLPQDDSAATSHSPTFFKLYLAADQHFSELLRKPEGVVFKADITSSSRSVDVEIGGREGIQEVYALLLACNAAACSRSCIGHYQLS